VDAAANEPPRDWSTIVRKSAALAGSIALLWFRFASAGLPAICTEAKLYSPRNPYRLTREFTTPYPQPDFIESEQACFPFERQYAGHETRPDSIWLTSEREWATQALAKESADLLVVPMQVQSYGIDRAERALMTLELVEALSTSKHLKLTDPRLTSQALGEGFRRFSEEEIVRVGKAANAHYFLAGYVGHDSKHHLLLTLRLINLKAPGAYAGSEVAKQIWQHDWPAIAFTDEAPPALTIRTQLASIVSALPNLQEPGNWRPGALETASAPSHLGTPIEVVSSDRMSGSNLAILSLLGTLTSSYAELPRERIFERALLAAYAESVPAADRAFFQAYALMYLEQRPAALAALSTADTPESNTLRALLNGDLPGATGNLRRVSDPMRNLLLSIAVHDLQTDYKVSKPLRPSAPAAVFAAAAKKAWDELIALRLDDHAPWVVHDPILIKRSLDRSFPVSGLDIRAVVTGQALTGKGIPDDVDIDIASMRHLRSVARTLGASGCCDSQNLRASRADLLDVFVSLTEGRITKALFRTSQLQGSNAASLQALERYRPLLDGHPLISLARAEASAGMLDQASDDERASMVKEANRNARDAAYYAQGINYFSRGALGVEDDAIIRLGYGNDYPPRPYWSMPDPDRTSWALQALAFSRTDPSPFLSLPAGSAPDQQSAVAASLTGRFIGDPTRPSGIPLPGRPAVVPTGDRLADARAVLQSSPGDWDNYWSLARAQIELTGDYAAAAATLRSYPAFAVKAPQDAVAVGNYAYQAGTWLCFQGQAKLGTPFLRIAGNSNTGSNAELDSNILLKVLDNDFVAAMFGSLQEVERYQEASTYRNALVWLHGFGKSDEAWTGFSQVMASFEDPAVWTSALAGHRRAGLDEAGARAWMLRPEIRNASSHGRQFAQYYAILFNATDRMPPPDLGKLIDQIEGKPVWKTSDQGDAQKPSTDMAGYFESVSPSRFRRGKVKPLPPGTPIRSRLALFADAYADLRYGRFDAAVSEFVNMADHYPVEFGDTGFALPYFSWAAAKTGDKIGLEAFVLSWKAEWSFDYWLSLAFFAGVRHDVPAADAALARAFRVRPSSDKRAILTQFQYAEACEWLYKETSDVRFRSDLVEWAKKWQRVRPVDAWTYSMQYTYETAPDQRLRALAMTMYLDPASPRISGATKAERASAQAWLHDHNPFHIEHRPGNSRGPVDTASAATDQAGVSQRPTSASVNDRRHLVRDT
jgi:hypothetical protein